jgi:hypothetical protein
MIWWNPNISNEQKNILGDPTHLLHNDTVTKVQQDLLDKGTAYTWFTFCNEFKDKIRIDINAFQDRVINSKEAKYIFQFAVHIPGADLRKLEDAILASNLFVRWDYEWVAKFAVKIPGINVRKFENLVVEARHPKAAYLMLKYVKGTNPRKVKDILIKSGKSRYVYELAKHLPLKERKALEDMIVANKSNMYVRLFAQKVPGADKKKLERRIVRTRNADQITKFADKVPGSKCKRLVPLF